MCVCNVCLRQRIPKNFTLFCLVDIKKHTVLTFCVFWFVYYCSKTLCVIRPVALSYISLCTMWELNRKRRERQLLCLLMQLRETEHREITIFFFFCIRRLCHQILSPSDAANPAVWQRSSAVPQSLVARSTLFGHVWWRFSVHVAGLEDVPLGFELRAHTHTGMCPKRQSRWQSKLQQRMRCNAVSEQNV